MKMTLDMKMKALRLYEDAIKALLRLYEGATKALRQDLHVRVRRRARVPSSADRFS